MFLRNLPFGARVGSVFFAHAGLTAGATLEQLSRRIQADLDAHDFDAASLLANDSVLEAEGW